MIYVSRRPPSWLCGYAVLYSSRRAILFLPPSAGSTCNVWFNTASIICLFASLGCPYTASVLPSIMLQWQKSQRHPLIGSYLRCVQLCSRRAVNTMHNKA